ncbi:MAG: recombinase RecT [Bacteroidales bacterium]|nr:recombinase RecT [Acholeplasmataceae bacterium]MCK9449954.1 recombinase RecT [Bacteroidales bacterium]
MADNTQKVVPFSKKEVATAINDRTIADSILQNFDLLVTQGQLKFPQNYNLGNQLKLAYLVITQESKLRGATSTSVGQALTHMVLQGLEIDKNQCYFIKYGNELKMFRSYFGDVAVALRTRLVKDIKAVVIYDGDEFETNIINDEEVVIKHTTSFKNRDNPIVGAYAVAILPGGDKRYTVMTKKEIDANWSKSTNPDKKVQKEFPQEMSKRTVIRRAVKMLFNSANTEDNYVSAVIGSFNKTTEDEYVDAHPVIGKTTVSNTIDLPEDFEDEIVEEIVATPAEEIVEEEAEKEVPVSHPKDVAVSSDLKQETTDEIDDADDPLKKLKG